MLSHWMNCSLQLLEEELPFFVRACVSGTGGQSSKEGTLLDFFWLLRPE